MTAWSANPDEIHGEGDAVCFDRYAHRDSCLTSGNCAQELLPPPRSLQSDQREREVGTEKALQVALVAEAL